MKTWKKLQITMALVSCLGFVMPAGFASAAAPSFAQDVAMQQGGQLQGKVMNTAGTSVAGAKVRVQTGDQVVAEVATDANGAFTFHSLRGGVYQVATAGTSTQFRLWAAQTAPPHAAKAALLVANTDIVRGQCGSCCTEPSCDCGGGECYDSCTAPSCGCDGGGCGCGGGGCGCGGCAGGPNLMPWLIGAGIAAAIAIPLALDDDDAS